MGVDDDSSGTTPVPARWGAWDTAVLLCLAVAGLAYFGRYHDCGFNYGDEGSVVLITSRLFAGERPFLDLDLGYGLLWYYPLVLLFKITGVSFIAARIYFLSLALVTSLLAFLAVRRQTRRLGLAAAVALLTLAVPGTLHKAYLPLIVIANMLFLPSLDGKRTLLGRGEVLAAGLVAAVSYHIRPDLGLVVALVLSATLVLHTISRTTGWRLRIRQLGRLSALLGAAALVPTLPLVISARNQGFLDPFLTSLYRPILFLSESAHALLAFAADVARPIFGPQIAWAASPQPADSAAREEAGKTLARIPWQALWEDGADRSFAILTYLPLLTLTIIFAVACCFMFREGLRSQPVVTGDTLGVLALLGLAGSALPQFFLFRPDVSHLSQFMPGWVVLLGVCFGRWLLPAGAGAAAISSAVFSRRRRRLPVRAALAGFLIFHAGFYTWFGLSRPASGSIAMARHRSERFHGENGVDVAVLRSEKRLFTAAKRIIERKTNEGDAVLCLPYCPGFNVMTRRRTFIRRLYVDDAIPTLDPGWQLRTIVWSEAERVPLIIIQDIAVNGTEISRFKNWATDFMIYVRADYRLLRRVGDFEFYVRRRPRWRSHSSSISSAQIRRP